VRTRIWPMAFQVSFVPAWTLNRSGVVSTAAGAGG
jgi:hypothetical protein